LSFVNRISIIVKSGKVEKGKSEKVLLHI